MEYILFSSILLFLPGLAITYLFRIENYRFLISFSLSYSLFVFLFKSLSFIGQDAEAFSYVYIFLVSLVLLLAVLKYFRIRKTGTDICDIKCSGCIDYSRYLPLFIVISVALYFLWVGAYLEIPADIFRHLEFIQAASRNIMLSEQTNIPVIWMLGANGKFWHYLYSFLASWSDLSLQDAILPASFFNVTVFLLGIFCFSQVVFRNMQNSTRILMLTSLVTVLFTFLHFGINIFAFVRYYALAPVILNFILYFAVMAIVIDFFRNEEWEFRYLIVAAIIFSASIFIHLQEAMFLFLMFTIMSFYLFFQKHAESLKLLWLGKGFEIRLPALNFFRNKINFSFLLTQVAMVSLFLYSYLFLSRNSIDQGKIISLEYVIPFIKNLYILNPNYQFFNVVTVWGVFVIILFLLNIKSFRNNPYLMAGMLSPFFTVFNPFFTDLFLRHSLSMMLWRITFMLPLNFVAAYLFVDAIQYAWRGDLQKKVYGAVTVILLVVFLFPIQTTYFENNYSRIMTLKSVPVENTPQHWRDMIEFLDSLPDRKNIITDPVTGYMLSALTRHSSHRHKFHRRLGGYIEFNYEDYSSNPFDQYEGFLFIVNRRNGGMSETGRVARHWPEEILQLNNFYNSENMEDYISSNPDRFRLLWEKDKIRVYSLGLLRNKVRAK